MVTNNTDSAGVNESSPKLLKAKDEKGPRDLVGLWNMARPERFERPTAWFVARYSIQLSYGRVIRLNCEAVRILVQSELDVKLFAGRSQLSYTAHSPPQHIRSYRLLMR